MLSTEDDQPIDWLRAAQALLGTWLEATAAGLAVSLRVDQIIILRHDCHRAVLDTAHAATS